MSAAYPTACMCTCRRHSTLCSSKAASGRWSASAATCKALLWLQVHLAEEELAHWLQDDLVLTWGNAAQPEDLKDLVISVTRNVLSKARSVPVAPPDNFLAPAQQMSAATADSLVIPKMQVIPSTASHGTDAAHVNVRTQTSRASGLCYPPQPQSQSP